MKKKLALLLVLSMILSMIPMNVFGASYVNVNRLVTVPKSATPQTRSSSVIVDARWLATSSSSIELSVNEDATILTVDAVDTGSTGIVYGSYIAAPNANHVLFAPTVNASTLPKKLGEDYITFDITVKYDADKDSGTQIKLTAVMLDENVNNDGSVLYDEETITIARIQEENYSITAGDLVEFTDSVKIDKLTIKENAIGVLKNDVIGQNLSVVFVLDTPGFEWSRRTVELDSNRQMVSPKEAAASTVRYGTYGKKDAIMIELEGTFGTQSGLAELYVQNLGIMPIENAKYGNVKVKPYVITGTLIANFDKDAVDAKMKKDDVDTITVAKYVDYGLETYYDKDSDLADFELISGKLEQKSVTFHLSEITPYSWGASRAAETRFTVSEGVNIVSADVKLYDSDADKDLFDDNYELTKNAVRNEEGVLVKANYLSVAPYLYSNKAVLENTTYDLTVTLTLNVEPGYVQRHESDEITVAVSGAAIGSKKISDLGNEFVIATVVDPITVEVDVADVTADATGLYPTNDIVITENFEGALEVGTYLWVGLDADLGALRALDVASVKATGVSIGKINRGNYNSVSTNSVGSSNGVWFEITKESDEDNLGVITLSGVDLAGFAFSGLKYNLAVSGDAVAEDDYDWSNGNETNVNSLFTDFYYYKTPLINFATSTVGNVNNNVGPAAQIPGAAKQTHVLTEGMMVTLSNGNTVQGYTYKVIGENKVGYISARYFADLLGIDPDSLWDAETGICTISYNGVTVTLQKDNTNMNINGVDYDIAAYAAVSGPAGSIKIENINDALYLPARALATAFGYVVNFNAGVTTLQ